MHRKTMLTIACLAGTAICSAADNSDANQRIIACWGDSITEGMAMPRDKTYPARLAARLGKDYKVLNSGDGGENTVTIPVRQGAYRISTATEFKFDEGVNTIRIGDQLDNGFWTPRGEKIKLTSALGREIPVNDITICGQKFKLSFKDFKWNNAQHPITYELLLTRNGDAAQPLTIPAGSPVLFNSVTIADKAYCEIYFMGANGGWNNDVQLLISQYKAMITRHGEKAPYMIIMPYWGGFSAAQEDAFRKAFGEHMIEFRREALLHGLQDQGLTPTALDRQLMQKGQVPPSLEYQNTPNVHLNEFGYDFLAELIYKQGQQLGYWK